MENAFYEGPLRLRLPVAMQLDADGAFSFEAPLPSPEGALGAFVDGFKALVIPSHLRPPAQVRWGWRGGRGRRGVSRRGVRAGRRAGCSAGGRCWVHLAPAASEVSRDGTSRPPLRCRPWAQAVNWIALSGDPAVDAAMQVGAVGAAGWGVTTPCGMQRRGTGGCWRRCCLPASRRAQARPVTCTRLAATRPPRRPALASPLPPRACLQRQVAGALEAIQGVLVELAERIEEQGLEAEVGAGWGGVAGWLAEASLKRWCWLAVRPAG